MRSVSLKQSVRLANERPCWIFCCLACLLWQGVAVLARDVSTRLAQELHGIEQQFLRLSSLIHGHTWSEASRLSGGILVSARAFDKYVASELDAARRKLECCHKVFAAPSSNMGAVTEWIVGFLVLLALVACSAMGVSCVRRRATPRRAAPATFRTEDSHMLRSLLGAMPSNKRTHMM